MMTLTAKAKQRIQTLKDDFEKRQQKKIVGVYLAVKGMPRPEYALSFVEEGQQEPDDVAVVVDDITVRMASRYAEFLSDVQIDFVSTLQQTGFKVDNPKSVPAVPDTSSSAGQPVFEAVKKVIDVEINPGLASHGGYVTLLDVKDNTAYVRMGGGCQGCGMAAATMRQGVEVAIKKAVPEILDVVDGTNHAGGENPYYASDQ